ncbi:unnamed protein product, partial [marine sediment metagenome]
ANLWEADLVVSIHADAFHKITAKGISTHVHPRSSLDTRILARWVQAKLIENFVNHVNRGIRESDFHILRETEMPAILVECEFLSNPETRRFLREPENQLGLAKAISNGINLYAEGESSEI